MTLRRDIRRAYDTSGEVWGEGPARVYRALAQPVVVAAGEVTGQRVLDVGTGSGVLADALVRRGARVIGVDLSWGMLHRAAEQRPPAVVGDVCALPCGDRTSDLVTASFVLNHLPDPVAGARELARVLRPGGRLLATTFEGDAPHPAKAAVEEIARSFGYEPPPWYRSVKDGAMALLGTPAEYERVGVDGGLCDVRVQRVPVVVPLTSEELVGWRLGMAQTAPFVAALPPDQRREMVRAAQVAVSTVTDPVELVVLLLAARR